MNPPIRTRVIVNPNSKPRRIKRYLKRTLHILKKNGFSLSVVFTKSESDASFQARRALEDDFQSIIVAGGDGTLNEVINAIQPDQIPIGILPFGGSNVLARELGIPRNPVEAAHVIGRRYLKIIDLGRIHHRYFTMMASCGYDAYAISRTDKKIKKLLHNYAYIWAGLKDFIGYRPSEIHADLDEGKVLEKGTFIVVSNTHFYGGEHQLTPFAEIDDGLLDVCVYKGKYQIGLIRFAMHMFAKKHLSRKNVRYYRVKKARLFAPSRMVIQADGDIVGTLPVTAEVVPRALKVYC